jgi:DNA polymerase-3 subunit gamma/tau
MDTPAALDTGAPAGRVESASGRIETRSAEPAGLDTGAGRPTRSAEPAGRPTRPAEPSVSERIVTPAAPLGPVYGFGAAAAAGAAASPEPAPASSAPSSAAPAIPSVVTFQQVKDSWPEILERVEKAKRTAWMVLYTATPLGLRDGTILDLSFASQTDVDALKQRTTPGEGVSDFLKQAVYDVLGFRPLLTARAEAPRADAPVVPIRATQPSAPPTASRPPVAEEPSTEHQVYEAQPPERTEPDVEPQIPAGVTWETAVITDSEPETKRMPSAVPKAEKPAAPTAPEPAAPKRAAPVATADGKQRYGESVVREILGASFIEEQTVLPRVAPREQ